MEHLLTPCDDLWEVLRDNFDFSWFSNGSYLKGDNCKYCAGYLTVTSFDVEAASLPMATTMQEDEIYAFTWPTSLLHPWDSPGKSTGVGCHFLLWAGTLAKGKNVNIYSSSKYAFRVPHNFGMLWKQGASVADKKAIMTPCWNCSFDFILVACVIMIIWNDLPQRLLPLCLTVKLKCLCSEPCPPVDSRKLTPLLPEVCHSMRCSQD